jgi:hypothetical protein
MIIYCNNWDVWCDLFVGTEQECVIEYEKHIEKYESIGAIICKKGKTE